ncbi:hypothetical protein [Paraburkholderia phosphatilytica]|uniref:hypothetical protein n=1 Tax=Paraburkholderia phosphatilytica TaxID=2282883 RepID=UPI000E492957|nr:hypothetical protein [Paraburkholderia phosphatilytica]
MQIDFAHTFGARLRVLEEFMLAQDPASAQARIEELRCEVLRLVDLVKLHPEIGRPAGILAASSIEGQRRLERVLRLANDAGLPDSANMCCALTSCFTHTQIRGPRCYQCVTTENWDTRQLC